MRIKMAQIRYIRQRDTYSCGPIAIINTLKWLGHENITYKLLPAIRMMCKCEYEFGTHDLDLERTLKALGIKKKRKVVPTIKEIDKHLDNDGIIILQYSITPFDGHYVLCIRRTAKSYFLVNDSNDRTISRMSRGVFKRLIKWDKNDEKPWAWFIYKDKQLSKTNLDIRSYNGRYKKIYSG
jgi:predicted double-glycine peptidase